MIDLENLPEDIISVLKTNFGDDFSEIDIPPSAFKAMGGVLHQYNLLDKTLVMKFPVKESFLNQFRNMNGGMIASAIDNTFGPLSMLVAPPNFTRQLEVKFRKPIPESLDYIFVHAYINERKKRQLILSAKVSDELGCVYATANATHWIIS